MTERTGLKTDTTQMKLLLIECKNLMSDLFARGNFRDYGPTRSRLDNLCKHIDRTVYG